MLVRIDPIETFGTPVVGQGKFFTGLPSLSFTPQKKNELFVKYEVFGVKGSYRSQTLLKMHSVPNLHTNLTNGAKIRILKNDQRSRSLALQFQDCLHLHHCML